MGSAVPFGPGPSLWQTDQLLRPTRWNLQLGLKRGVPEKAYSATLSRFGNDGYCIILFHQLSYIYFISQSMTISLHGGHALTLFFMCSVSSSRFDHFCIREMLPSLERRTYIVWTIQKTLWQQCHSVFCLIQGSNNIMGSIGWQPYIAKYP